MRTYQLNDSLEAYIKGLDLNAHEVGAVLGRHGVGQRDLVFGLFKQQGLQGSLEDLKDPDTQPSNKKARHQAPKKQAIEIDALVEFLHRLDDFLIGGVSICGLYCGSSCISSNEAAVQLSKALSQYAAEKGRGQFASALILHIDTSTHKLTGKEAAITGKQAAALKPCEIKFQDLGRHMIPLTCRHGMDLGLCLEASSQSLGSQMLHQLRQEVMRIRASVPTSAGSLPKATANVLDACTRDSSGACNLELLCPPSSQSHPPAGEEDGGTYDARGQLRISGCLVGQCLAFDREPFSTAAELLREDIVHSLEARGELMMAEAEESGEEHLLMNPAGSGRLEMKLPQRAFFPTQEPWLRLSSHHFPGEGDEEVQAAAQEVMSSSLSANDIEWPEKRMQQSNSEKQGSRPDLGEGRPDVPFGLKTGKQALSIAVAICLISCLLSYILARTR